MTIIGHLFLTFTSVAAVQEKDSGQETPGLVDINSSTKFLSKILMLKNDESTCSASIIKFKTKKYLVTAAHCLPKSPDEKFMNVYEGTTATLEDSIIFGREIKLGGLKKKTQVLISNGLKYRNYDIFILPLHESQFTSTLSLEVRLSELSNQERITPFGYPESVGPFGSECQNQGGYITGPSFGVPAYRPVMEIYCKDSENFAVFSGMSGGPVIDSKGFFVGVLSAQNLGKNVGQRLNYVQIVPAVVIRDLLELKENKLPSFQFTDYQFSSMDEIDHLAAISGYDIGIFIDINKIVEFPRFTVSLHENPTEIETIVGDFTVKNLQIKISRSSPNATLFSYEIKRISDGQVLEAQNENITTSTFKDFRRLISKKIEKYL